MTYRCIVFVLDQMLVYGVVAKSDKNCYDFRLYDGLERVFRYIRKNGIPVIIIGQKSEPELKLLAEQLGIPYSYILSYQMTGTIPTYHQALHDVLVQMKVKCSEAIMFVGDRRYMSPSLFVPSVKTVMCLWGIGESNHRSNFKYKYQIDSPFEMLHLLDSSIVTGRYETFKTDKLGKPYYFFYYYVANRDLESEKLFDKCCYDIRNEIFNFKSGNFSQLYSVIKDQIVRSFDDPSRLTFLCIPASTKVDNDKRYRLFSEKLCSELKMENANLHIKIIKEKEKSHLGAQRPRYDDGPYYKLDDLKFFEGKNILLFDDVVTTGQSMKKFIEVLEVKYGGKVICCMSIAETYCNRIHCDDVIHPYNGIPVLDKLSFKTSLCNNGGLI